MAEQSDPLAPVCALLAAELLGGAARQATPTPLDTSPPEEAMPEHVVADDLEDAAFSPSIERPARRSAPRRAEGDITTEVLHALNARPGHRFQKMHQGAHSGSGEPDLDGCVRVASGLGRSVKIEMKAGTNPPTAKQHRRLLQWQEAGALVGWARSLDEVDAILARADDPTYRYVGQPGATAPDDAPPAPEVLRDQHPSRPRGRPPVTC